MKGPILPLAVVVAPIAGHGSTVGPLGLVAVGVETGVTVGGRDVAVGGSGVTVSGRDVAVGGSGVTVDGRGVAVGVVASEVVVGRGDALYGAST